MAVIRHCPKKTKILRYKQHLCKLSVEEVIFRVDQPGSKSKTYRKSPQQIVFGRDPQADIIIEEEGISRRHCRFYEQEGQYYLEDLKSTNGTYYGDKRISVQCVPPEGKFRVGKTKIQFWIKQVKNKIKGVQQMAVPSHLVAEDLKMQRLLFLAQAIASNDVSILLQGETGTGKEEIAKLIHSWSPRKPKPFIAINCATSTEEVLENTFFGHEKGAFTGATDSKMGVFEEANEGTLFLDEVGEMPLSVQGALLRVLETGTVRKLGRSKQETKVNVRIIAGTNRNLKEEVAAKRFREDLYYRLESVTVFIPPLRERKGDIPKLVENFIQSQKFVSPKILTECAMQELLSHSWPGNIRQLKNHVLKLLLDPETGNIIEAKDVRRLNNFEKSPVTEKPSAFQQARRQSFSPLTLDEARRLVIIDTIRTFPEETIENLARRLKISRPQLTAMIRRYKINVRLERAESLKKI